MSDYTEHLISMAGGDGVPDALDLDAIQARWDAAQKTLANDPSIVSIMQLHRLNESANDIPALLALVREQAAKLERVKAIHKPINVYDECECTDGTHPEEYELIDREDHNGCENSFSHYACESCCTANDYITEWCSDTHDHSTDTGNQCPTIAALTATEGAA